VSDIAAPEAKPMRAPEGSPAEVFWAFLKLGLTSFGGPVAHIGYFRNEFVLRRQWLTEAAYADLVGLCQFLPGPASSQVGFSLGLLRGRGLLGGLMAWLGFTAPSALLMLAFAFWASALTGPVATGVLHGLKLVAVAVVAQAVWGMARTLAPDQPRAGIALTALAMVVVFGGAGGQIAAIVLGAALGLLLCRSGSTPVTGTIQMPVSRRAAFTALALFVALFGLSACGAFLPQAAAIAASFYRAGALVFGGGHVVLPLLQDAVVKPGWVNANAFITGYGAAQALPGPLFTFAAYLGALIPGPAAITGALIALIAIFLPGLLLVYATLPFWDALRTRKTAQAAMRGANAAVVGILASALYNPVWTSAIHTQADFALAAFGFLLLTVWRAPPWAVVILLAAAG
jgi:chromate transporter